MDFQAFLRTRARLQLGADELVYEFIAEELAKGVVKQGLWTKALADVEWNEAKAKALYVRLRFKQVKEEYQRELATHVLATETFGVSPTLGSTVEKAVDAARAAGLSEEEISYLGVPIIAVQYLEKHRWDKDNLAVACARKMLNSVMIGGVLWVADRKIDKPSFLQMPDGDRILD